MNDGQFWLDQTRSQLLGGYSEQMNRLSASYTSGGTSLTFEFATGGITPGAILSIGFNNFYVWSVAGQVATVTGGYRGSTAADAASGSVVQVAPRFTDYDIWQALSADLSDLSSPVNGLYGIGTVDFTYSPQVSGYSLGSIADELLDVYEVKYLTPGPYKNTPRIPRSMWRVNRNVNTSEISSGLSLELFTPAYPGFSVRATYKKILTMPSSAATSLSTTGLQASAYDLPPLGAAIRLMAGREIKRNFTESQGDTRRGLEVPPGAVQQSANGLKQIRAQRILAECNRLNSLYPIYKL